MSKNYRTKFWHLSIYKRVSRHLRLLCEAIAEICMSLFKYTKPFNKLTLNLKIIHLCFAESNFKSICTTPCPVECTKDNLNSMHSTRKCSKSLAHTPKVQRWLLVICASTFTITFQASSLNSSRNVVQNVPTLICWLPLRWHMKLVVLDTAMK